MPTLPLHPALVHLPLALALVMPLVAIGFALAYRLGRISRRSFAILAGLQLALVASGVVAMQLGERDAKRVEAIVGEQAVEAHEERAEVFVWSAGAVLAGAAAILVVPAGAVGITASIVAAGTVAVAGLAFRTGEAGGELVYVRGAASAFATPAGVRPAPAAVAHDDD